jgi:probable rRNA maturation factor
MIRLNNQFLGHDYLTDVICFNYLEDETVSDYDYSDEAAVELFISPGIALQRTAAKKVPNDYSTELALYIIHGILHAAGFDDKKDKDKQIMYTEQDRILHDASAYFAFNELFPLN